jgi:hypothetical protein
VPPATIARLYFDPEAPHAASSAATERYRCSVCDDLVQPARLHGSTVVADHLKKSIRQHGCTKLTAVSLRMVERASKTPLADHPVDLWFRPLIAQRQQARTSRHSASSSRGWISIRARWA